MRLLYAELAVRCYVSGKASASNLALKRAAVPAELHIYANTTHDFGVRTNAHPYSKWTESCANWLRDQGFLQRSVKE